MSEQRLLLSFPPPPNGTIYVNDRVSFRTEGTERVISVHGVVFAHYDVGDSAAEAYAMITLWESEYASQIEIARSFGYSARSLRRYQKRLEAGGISALIRGPGRPSGGSKNAKERGRDQTILHLKAKGASNRTIAGKLGLSEKAIRKRLRRLGWRPNPEPAESGLLFQEQTNGGAFPRPAVSDPPMDNPAPESAAASATPLARSEDIESAPISLDPNPLDRSLDRLLAALGPARRCRTGVRACR